MDGSRKRSAFREMHADVMRAKTALEDIPADTVVSIRSKFNKNYFGLPPYSMQQTAAALTYMCRKPLVLHDDENDLEDLESTSESLKKSERLDTPHRKNHDQSAEHGQKQDQYAQRKVASALLIMAKNPLMRKHFLTKGGYEAALKLIAESKDVEVLHFCGQCLIQVSLYEENARTIIEKGIFNGISYFCESTEDALRSMAAVIIALLSSAKDMDEVLVMSNALMYLQSLMTHCHRPEAICHLLLGLSNIAPSIVGSDSEVAMRLCFQATKKIDFSRSPSKALFISDVYSNFSRLNHYSSLLVDEGILPLLLHMIDIYLVDKSSQPSPAAASTNECIVSRCAEALANLSINRKNRREIASCGIASRLAGLFENGSHATCASILLLMGNLLSSNLFHDKVANATTITNLLDNLFDVNHPKQFNAVSYCLCQLSKSILSCEILVKCKVIPIVLGYLHNCPHDSVDYLWTVVHTISQYPQFFPDVMEHHSLLVGELYEEIKFETTSPHQLLSVCKITLNVTQYKDFYSFLSTEDLELFVKSLKIILSSPISSSYIQMMTLVSLINLARYCQASRSLILGSDLIELFSQIGIEDDYINVKYVELLHLISNEEVCCYRLLEMNVQRFLISLQDSFQRLLQGNANYKKPEKKHLKGQSIANLSAYLNTGNAVMNAEALARSMNAINTINQMNNSSANGGSGGMGLDGGHNSAIPVPLISNINSINITMITNHLDPIEEGEYGKALTAATLHNIALKRPILSPGALAMILSLAKNCKTLRVLHCIRTLAHMSIYNKSKIILSKEFKKVIPMLTVIMRCGCDEAEKVQYYCAIILCNILSLSLDKTLLLELVKSNAITDLMVVTLLRINNLNTKETLAKTFYNLLGRNEIRELLITNMDILSAILELLKLEYNDLLELCIRALYNISCELKPGSGMDTVYASKFSVLKITSIIVHRLIYSPNMIGNVPTRPIRLLLGMAIANMSFNKQLVLEIANVNNVSSSNALNSMTSFASVATNAITSATQGNAHSQNNSHGHGHGHHPENKLSDALYRVFALNADESTYCAIVTLYNISKLPECRVLADSKAIPLCVEILTNDTNVLNIQLATSVLCNFSAMVVFHEQLTNEAVEAIVKVLASPSIHLTIKIDAIQAVYNIILNYPQACTIFVQAEVVSAMWKLLKVFGGSSNNNANNNAKNRNGGGTNLPSAATKDDGDSISVATGMTSTSSPSKGSKKKSPGADADEGEEVPSDINDEEVYILISHIIRLLCHDVVQDTTKLNKMLQDGIMNIILKLAKLEIVTVKVDMSFAIYTLSKGFENLKLLKRDAVDILFWLTIHDTLNAHNLILQNISRTLRSFSIASEEAMSLIKQDRFISIIKLLVKSKHEDILWQTAGILYNLMQYEYTLKKLVGFGLISFIFEIAACDFVHVKHVCSACLHIVPEHLPNMEDPLVLELVLCLLDAQGDKFSEVSTKPMDNLEYPYGTIIKSSNFVHTFTPFVASWTPYTCLLETFFSPATLPSHNDLRLYNAIDIPPVDPAQINSTEKHGKIHPKTYGDFNIDLTPSAANTPTGGEAGSSKRIAYSSNVNPTSGEVLSVPPVIGREPPGHGTTTGMSEFSTTPVNSRPASRSTDMGGQTSLGPSNRPSMIKTPNNPAPILPPQSAPPMSALTRTASSISKSAMLLSSTGSLGKSSSLPLLSAPATLPVDTVSAITGSIRSRAQSRAGNGGNSVQFYKGDYNMTSVLNSKSQESLYADSFVTADPSQPSATFSYKAAALPSPTPGKKKSKK